jgi:hypothetical protein
MGDAFVPLLIRKEQMRGDSSSDHFLSDDSQGACKKPELAQNHAQFKRQNLKKKI